MKKLDLAESAAESVMAALDKRAEALSELVDLISQAGAAFVRFCQAKEEANNIIMPVGGGPRRDFLIEIGMDGELYPLLGALMNISGLKPLMQHRAESFQVTQMKFGGLDLVESVKAKQRQSVELLKKRVKARKELK